METLDKLLLQQNDDVLSMAMFHQHWSDTSSLGLHDWET